MSDVSSNDFENEIEEVESVVDESESEDDDFESEEIVFESEDELVTIPLQFEHEGERYEIQAVTLASDRATSTVDYSMYFENITTVLFLIVSLNLAVGMVICFLLGVKK